MQSTSLVSHLVSLRASAGNSARLGARLETLVALSINTPGCLHIAVQKSMSEDDMWLINGLWADKSAMNDWITSPELDIFSELMVERLLRSLDFQTFTQVTSAPTPAACGLPGARTANQ